MDIQFWTLVLDGLRTVGIGIGAVWVWWRFVREREHAAHIGFTVDAILHGPSGHAYAIEYILVFENKGKTRIQLSDIDLNVRGIKAGEPLREWRGHEPRLEFGHSLLKDSVLPKGYSYMFAEPGIRQEYKYLALLPIEYKFINIRGEFRYENGNPHSAEKMIDVDNIKGGTVSP